MFGRKRRRNKELDLFVVGVAVGVVVNYCFNSKECLSIINKELLKAKHKPKTQGNGKTNARD